MSDEQRFGVVILAGGEGRRVGGRKPLKMLQGKTLGERALTSARQCSGPVAIAVRSADQFGGDAGVALLCDSAGEGPLAGLASAYHFAEANTLDGILLLPCDTPLLPADLMARLSGAKVVPGGTAVASSGGRLHPTVSLWRRAGLQAVPCYIASGKSSLVGLLELVGFTAVEWAVDPHDPFLNVNSNEDLRTAAAILSRIER